MNRREFMKLCAVSVAGIGIGGAYLTVASGAKMMPVGVLELGGKLLSHKEAIERGEVCIRETCPWLDWKTVQECKYAWDCENRAFLCRAEHAQKQEIRRTWARMEADAEKTHKRDSKGIWQPLPEKQA